MDSWKRQSILQIIEKLELNKITLTEAKQYADTFRVGYDGRTKRDFIKSILKQVG